MTTLGLVRLAPEACAAPLAGKAAGRHFQTDHVNVPQLGHSRPASFSLRICQKPAERFVIDIQPRQRGLKAGTGWGHGRGRFQSPGLRRADRGMPDELCSSASHCLASKVQLIQQQLYARKVAVALEDDCQIPGRARRHRLEQRVHRIRHGMLVIIEPTPGPARPVDPFASCQVNGGHTFQRQFAEERKSIEAEIGGVRVEVVQVQQEVVRAAGKQPAEPLPLAHGTGRRCHQRGDILYLRREADSAQSPVEVGEHGLQGFSVPRRRRQVADRPTATTDKG
jgi:hypothetical protein